MKRNKQLPIHLLNYIFVLSFKKESIKNSGYILVKKIISLQKHF